jgi:cytochrome P450
MKKHEIQTQLELRRAPRFYKQWMLPVNPSDFLNRLISDFGDFVHYRGLFSFYLINDPELVKYVLKETHRQFDKNTVIYNRFRNALGNSLVNAEGAHWRRQRKLIQPSFNPASIKIFFNNMIESSNQLVTKWDSFAGSGNSFNVATDMNILTLEIAGKSLFSDGFNKAAPSIRKWTQVINKYSACPPIPILTNPRFPTPLNLKLKQVLKEYRAFIDGIIQERLENSPDKNDLLSTFLAIRDEETGEPMEDREIAEEVLGMIIGGHETSSTALTWIFYELDKNPAVEAKMVEEIQRVTENQQLEFEKVQELKYTKAVIQEAMRLHPPLWFENRNTLREVELGDSILPKGSMVILSRYALHRNSKVWKNPDLFDPNRFYPETPDTINGFKTSGAYIPFSSGPRVCIGRHFAMMEIIVILCTLLQKFRIRVSSDNQHAVATNLTMELRNGLLIDIEKRLNPSPIT